MLNGDVEPLAPTTLKFNFSNVPVPLIGVVPNTTTFKTPDSLAWQIAVIPRLMVSDTSHEIACGSMAFAS